MTKLQIQKLLKLHSLTSAVDFYVEELLSDEGNNERLTSFANETLAAATRRVVPILAGEPCKSAIFLIVGTCRAVVVWLAV